MIIKDKLSKWDSIKNKGKIEAYTIQQFLNKIKNPDLVNKTLIIEARNLLKNSGNDKLYKKKKKLLPIIQLNGYFSDRKDCSVESLSGFMYIDIDDVNPTEYKQSLQNNKYVYAAWNSLSETGLGILVKYSYNGDIANDYNLVLTHICKELNFPLDKNAKGLSRVNVISWDEELYLHKDSVVYNVDKNDLPLTEVKPSKGQKCVVSGLALPELMYSTTTHFSESGLQFKTKLSEYTADVMFIAAPFFKVNWPFTRAGTPQIVTKGNRNGVMSKFIHNLVLLNPYKRAEVKNMANYFNKRYCHPSLSAEEINSILSYKYSNINSLKPIGVRTKTVWVNPEVPNKREFYYKFLKLRTIDKIEEVLSWALCEDKKITVTYLAKESGLNRKTIYNAFEFEPSLKHLIDEHNNGLK